jgi:hypothetical protein
MLLLQWRIDVTSSMSAGGCCLIRCLQCDQANTNRASTIGLSSKRAIRWREPDNVDQDVAFPRFHALTKAKYSKLCTATGEITLQP